MFDFVFGTLAFLGVLYLVVYAAQLVTDYVNRRNRIAGGVYETPVPRKRRRQY